MRCGCCEGLVGQGSTKCESNSGGPSFAAKQQLSVFEGVREMMRRLIRKGEEGPPESIPPFFLISLIHLTQGVAHAPLSLSHSLSSFCIHI